MKKIKGSPLFVFVLLLIVFKSYGQKESDFRVSLSADPKMIVVGPYETSESGEWDLLLRFAYRRKHFEYSVFYEGFKAISYSSAGINVNYLFFKKDAQSRFNRLEFGVGPGFGVIVRKELDVRENFIELNGEFRYFFNKNIGLMFLGNLKYRSDLVVRYNETEPWRFSNFWGVIYRW
ncbi:hypothetical protein [Flavicella sp.]|uniref:hypothetical protein n=1 Tax=Flavicella sp. TaxID=2957742 RepID=UPI002601B9C4|nr:hypothetical protein [Flavicella sp.]MDG1806087.1 hypothetical protein [Flavicella sp.]MDG2279004.1 hypothetical protein [Flavicella sp.]